MNDVSNSEQATPPCDPQAPNGTTLEQSLSFEKLKFAQFLREYHHSALWEEEKHFTWLNSLVLSGQLLVFASDKLCPSARGVLVLSLAILGVLLSLLALRVLRAEGENFQFALRRFVCHYNGIYSETDDHLRIPTSVANRSFSRLLGLSMRGKQGIRDSFQVVFVVFILLFVGLAFAVVLLYDLEWRPWVKRGAKTEPCRARKVGVKVVATCEMKLQPQQATR